MTSIAVIVLLLALVVAPISAAEISGHVRAGNALASGRSPCITLDGAEVYHSLQPDGTFIVYAPPGYHVIGLTGELAGFEEYCYVRVGRDTGNHQCEFEGNGLATPSVYVTVEPSPVPTISPTASPTTSPTPLPVPTVTVVPTIVPTPVPTVTPTPPPHHHHGHHHHWWNWHWGWPR